jgi:hypothetical protein
MGGGRPDRFLSRCRAKNEANVFAPVRDFDAEFVPVTATPEEVDDDVIGNAMTEVVRGQRGTHNHRVLAGRRF